MSAHTGHTVIVVNGWVWCEDCGHALAKDTRLWREVEA